MVIKVIKKDNKVIAKGIPKRSKEAILVGILVIVFVSVFGIASPKPFNILMMELFGLFIIVVSLVYALKERRKAVREYNKNLKNRGEL